MNGASRVVPLATALSKCDSDGCFLISSTSLMAHCFGVSWTSMLSNRLCFVGADISKPLHYSVWLCRSILDGVQFWLSTARQPRPYSAFGARFLQPCPSPPVLPREARAPRLNVSALYQMDVGRHKKDGVLKAARNQAGL